jgi:Transglycosylase SLT domain/LysM domain
MYSCIKILLIVLVCLAGVHGQVNKRPPNPPEQLVEVTVESGDTLITIAQRHQIAPAKLAHLNHLSVRSKLRKGRRLLVPSDSNSKSSAINLGSPGEVIGKRIKLTNGRSLLVDEAWQKGTVVWFTRGGITQSLDGGVAGIESVFASGPVSESRKPIPVQPKDSKTPPVKQSATFIHLIGGARFKVDDVNETAAGAWYSRGTLSVFLARERIARIERIEDGSMTTGSNRDWTSGNPRVDELIKTNGARFGVDPYLIFCVIEQESHFKTRAVSPKDARGLMQLMPATARRLGVRRPFDPSDNIKGGTQYLRELMDLFSGEVNLVLASYNAGEGAVMKYGRSVPPYRETREYVRRIGKRYGLQGTTPSRNNELPTPQR